MKLSRIALAMLALGGAGIGVASAEKLSTKVSAELDRLLKIVITQPAVGPTRFGELAPGGVFRFVFQADATLEYYFNAVCDDDCVNLDLVAFEADGKEIDIDDADDNAPVINAQASVYKSVIDKPKGIPRPITVEVRMKACKTDACAFGVITSTDGD
jgi:hypothetical protein